MSFSRGETLHDALQVAGQMSWAIDKIGHTFGAKDAKAVGEAVTELLEAKKKYDKLIEKAADGA